MSNFYHSKFCTWCAGAVDTGGICHNPNCPGKQPKEEPLQQGYYKYTPYHNYGWLCPACGRGNAPFTQTCPCRPYPKYEVWC
jgi:hypothetical protein